MKIEVDERHAKTFQHLARVLEQVQRDRTTGQAFLMLETFEGGVRNCKGYVAEERFEVK